MAFKAGDKIQRKSDGVIDYVKSVPGMSEYDDYDFSNASEGMVTLNHSWEWQDAWKLYEESPFLGFRSANESPSWSVVKVGWDTAYKLPEDYKPIKKPFMKKLGTMMKKLLDADTQELVKAQYINGDLELTAVGKDALWTIIFSANKQALVDMAKEENVESEKVAE